MKKLKYFSILKVCLTLMVLSFTLVSCDLFDTYDSYDYGSNDYYPSTPSTPNTPSIPTTLPGTYYSPSNVGAMTFYRDGEFYLKGTVGNTIIYSDGTFSVSGNRIRLDDSTGGVSYWTIVNSTSVKDNNGLLYTKR